MINNSMNLQEQIYDLLEIALPKGEFVLATDDGLHYSLSVRHESFKNLTLLGQHKLVNNIIRPLIDKGLIHAISIKTSHI
ncbi:BolA-like protein [Rickettsiales endosymbiont of Paramecium tredecaurelia]|uniref:BolA/IbaG family iron-sulfur metabolism protein n=1 Tax=Candidatus Sarmatiella mevalonica TaxID=2770581 RepID=UPI001924631F|nr:BolA/IbaG family iron-sulfur metabolism protein [Candidatus Sarmatiella mevalonica]MBL3284258.1 BolA-like protein [Candidatus Sarmatiella mevalonica]